MRPHATPLTADRQTRGSCLPGCVLVKMALGEAPESIPSAADVRPGRTAPATGLDRGAVDRIVRHHAGVMRVSRLHAAARSVGRPGLLHRGFDEREHVIGLARTFRVDVPPATPIRDLVDALNQVSIVEIASPNYVSTTPFASPAAREADDAGWQPWRTVRADEALAHEVGDPAVVVAIVDSGVAPGHPDLPPLRAGYDTVQIGRTDLAMGLELLGDVTKVDINPLDRFVGHGMACAGIIGARGLGMPPGLAGAAQILPMRALAAARFPGHDQPVGIGAASDLDMAMKMAVDLGARVINMSFGTDDGALEEGAPKPHAEVVAYAIERGCVLVAASGNSGGEACYWPAAFPGVIAVGAVGADLRPTGFSTRGPHVAICAPGERIRTLALAGYQEVSGTSFAAPFVAATAALMMARAQQRSTPIDGEIVRALIVRSAAPFDGPPVSGCGSGVLDAAAALQALDAWIDERLPDATGQADDG